MTHTGDSKSPGRSSGCALAIRWPPAGANYPVPYGSLAAPQSNLDKHSPESMIDALSGEYLGMFLESDFYVCSRIGIGANGVKGNEAIQAATIRNIVILRKAD